MPDCTCILYHVTVHKYLVLQGFRYQRMIDKVKLIYYSVYYADIFDTLIHFDIQRPSAQNKQWRRIYFINV